MRRLVPAAVGLALAAALAVAVPDTRLYVEVAPALLAGLLGVLGTFVLQAGSIVRARRDAAAAAAANAVEQSRRRFVRRLDHELKNPLTALLAALAGREDTVEHAQAERIRRLLTDLRRVADVESVELDRGPVDVSELLREAIESATADAGTDRQIRVDVPSAPWPLPTVAGDADLLLIALYNLVSNAIKYTVVGDVVEVRARETGTAVTIEVADTGPGIAEDEQQLVWEELGRGRASAGRPGSGVGLALVRVIAARHGGTVGLRSRLGAGTSVYLTLPAP